MRPLIWLPFLLFVTLLTGCDKLAALTGKSEEAKVEEGKAIGGACRHAGRALEDCYTMNPDAHKAAIFAGWREMNDYMMENKIDSVKPVIPVPVPTPKAAEASAPAAAETKEAASVPAEDSKPAPGMGRRRPAKSE